MTAATRRALRSLTVIAAAGSSLAASCEESRDRPTGLVSSVPETDVRVRAPEANSFLLSDSTATIRVEAIGLLQAVGFSVVQTNPPGDTLASGRREFDPPIEVVEETFRIRLPTLLSGATLEIRAIAENLIGERALSEPVSVSVINCDTEPFRCG